MFTGRSGVNAEPAVRTPPEAPSRQYDRADIVSWEFSAGPVMPKRLNIHERFIRHIWSRQNLAVPMTTTDGRQVRVLEPGLVNHGAGPDILNATIRIGRVTYAGDVELHRTPFDWLVHRHQEDPRYNRVILHVVLESGEQPHDAIVESGRALPTIVLSRFLNEPIREVWRKAIDDERACAAGPILCSARNDAVDPTTIDAWLRKLSVERLEFKIRRYEERLRDLALECQDVVRESPRTWGDPPLEGDDREIPPRPDPTTAELSRKELWEQVLYEGLFDALGYSKNRAPFVRLAANVSLTKIRSTRIGEDGIALQALLFGAAGLLPSAGELSDTDARRYVRRLRRVWKSLNPVLRTELLHAADWVFSPTRPANFPTVRLAAGAGLIGKILHEDLFRTIVQTVKNHRPGASCRLRLLEALRCEPGDFWSAHVSFDRRSQQPVTLLGTSRMDDMIVNVVVPLVLLYGRMFHERLMRDLALQLLEAVPAAAPNAITVRLERHLLRGRVPLRTVPLQQGALQLFRCYCQRARCGECEVGRGIGIDGDRGV
jgi:hypothetical protein